MKINFVAKQTTVTDAIKDYAEKRLQRVKKFFADEDLDVTVTIEVQKKLQIVEVLIDTKGLFLKGIERSEDLYASIDLAVDKIYRQITKYKSRLKDHKTPQRQGSPLKMNVYNAESIEASKPEIIVSKNIIAKPMDVDEATMQMDLLNKDFYVYRNAAGAINVVYKRDDGNIGLFE